MAVNMSSVVKQLLYVLKFFRVTAGCIHSFRILSKETYVSDQMHVSKVSGFGYDPKNPPPLWIIWINNPFMDFSKEAKYPLSD